MVANNPENVNLLRNEVALGAYSNTPLNSRIDDRITFETETQNKLDEISSTGVLHPVIDALTLLWEDDRTLGTLDDVAAFLGIVFDQSETYSKSIATKMWTFCRGEHGTSLAWYESSPDVFTIRFTMSGVACSTFGADEVYLFCCFAREHLQARCTRMDINVTDKLKILKIDDVIEAVENGNYCGFRDYQIINSKRGKYKGTTVYFGNRNSGKFGRIYDKYAQSKGLEDGIRYEVEFKESLSDAAFDAYTASANIHRLATLANLLTGAFRLVEKIDKNLPNCPTLKFWEDFINRITTVHLSIKLSRKPTTIAKKLDWVRRNVVKSIGMLLDAIGWERLNMVLSHGVQDARARYSKSDERAVQEYRDYPGAIWDIDDSLFGLV
jgi:DNA relaxase NicK